MVNKTVISIIVPIYNAEQYLSECIDSLVNQSFEDIEIILINDGSTDNSSKICKEYEEKDKRINYIEIKNSGVSHARNVGVENANGKWITFIDADDWVSADYCEKLISYANEDVGLVIARTVSVQNGIIYGDGFQGRKVASFKTAEEKLVLYKSIVSDAPKVRKYPHIATCSAKLFRKDIIDKFKIRYKTSLKYYEDAIFNMEVIRNSNTVLVTSDILYYYRVNSTSSTQVFCDDTVKYYENAASEVKKIIINYSLAMEEDYYQFNIKNIDTFMTNYFKAKLRLEEQYSFVRNICNRDIFCEALNKVKWKDHPSKRRKIMILSAKLGIYLPIVCVYRIARKV